MKRCPECRRDYYDDSLLYCLDDGTALLEGPASSGGDGERTAVLHHLTGQHDEAATKILTKKRPFGVRSFKWMSMLALVLIGIATVGFFGYRYYFSPPQIRSIAVMPFVNVGADPELEYMADGMTESLINGLSQLSQLSVKGRSFVFRYKGKDVDPRTIAADLNVQALLNGRIVRRGDSIDVSLDLVDARTGDQAWGAQYTRGANDLAALQNDITREVSQKLVARLTIGQTKLNKDVSQNSEAYQLYLQGHYELNKRTRKGTENAIAFYQQSIEKDPSYAQAYVGLAEAYVLSDIPVAERGEKVRAAALKAIELDPSLGEPHASLASYKAWNELDYPGAEQEFKRAIELNPNYATAYHWYGEFLMFQGRSDEGLGTLRKALELDPYSPAIGSDYGQALFYVRRYDESIAHLKKLIDQDPNYYRYHIYIADVYEKVGRYEEAVNERTTAALIGGASADEFRAIQERLLNSIRSGGAQGYWSTRLSVFTEYRQRRGTDPMSNYPLWAELYSHLGQKDKAFEILNKGIDMKGDFPLDLKASPRWDDIRDDPRFDELLRKLKLN